jgi:hypothetical protein
MGRKHIWYYLKDEEGQPINGADINFYFTGGTTEAIIYDSRSTSASVPQSSIVSDPNGYFEFWVGDQFESPPACGYSPDQHFDLVWTSASGSGIVDDLQIFELIYPIDETDSTGIEKDKMVSNSFAFKWEAHVDRPYGTQPHDIQPVDETDASNGTLDKVVSDELMNRLYGFPITSGGLSIETSGALFTTSYLYPSGDTPSGTNVARDFDPDLQRTPLYPVVQIWEESTGDQIMPVEVKHMDNNLVRVILVSGSGTMIATTVGETGA